MAPGLYFASTEELPLSAVVGFFYSEAGLLQKVPISVIKILYFVTGELAHFEMRIVMR